MLRVTDEAASAITDVAKIFEHLIFGENLADGYQSLHA
jgi:hypothetical protein